ncbi:hypothetical protein [Acidovorax sp. SDU_ACID1]|uniref:hypothetical protein n=1 Tax=Acidovorax sp. SDU_ACID1 TaxID=3136632 RepID=UPI0038734A76
MTGLLETQRHQCEVRTLIRARREPSRGEEWVRGYLRDPKVAGRRAALIRDIKGQLDKGSTGKEGSWL